jgi:homoserine O-succinyltransferase
MDAPAQFRDTTGHEPQRPGLPAGPKAARRRAAYKPLTIALVNNMPPAARMATMRQFERLCRTDGRMPVRMLIFTLPGAHAIDPWARPIEALYETAVDGLIVTGTEPTTSNLVDEPFWPTLTELLDWADHDGIPTILSCLAAHAAVLHRDGIMRRKLAEKRFGLFDEAVSASDPLAGGLEPVVRMPHSRWNDLCEAELRMAGYEIVSASPDGGVSIFLKRRRGLTLCLQGHPEYDPVTLMLEYRRDARRFSEGKQASFPALPKRYFDAETASRLIDYEHRVKQALAGGEPPDFPSDITGPPIAPWRPCARRIYRNWLAHLNERRS